MSPSDGLKHSGHFGSAASGLIPENGAASATVEAVAGANPAALQAILGDAAHKGLVSTARLDHLALTARGGKVEVIQPGGVDLNTVDPKALEGKTAYSPKGLFVEDADVPTNANKAPSSVAP